ncbi:MULTISPECIES: DUF2304 domain-containing protein [Micrococcaceae]|uniref:DUF2304 domain-containing protein n=1 Tax=Micrococcaceae TaxID=1268 RepID=UPI0012F7BF42|nr:MULTISPECIES: DUF2304 domain-containing protein [unclassified Pseudarthrobacter]MEA3549704.1 DUF2304 domain-containing protein [Pseudarthrobacter sp. C1]MUU72939.1 DUF2304 family protein [Pseudarthrobacter sp. GA104]
MSLLMGSIVVVAILFFVFEMLRRQKLREKYAVLWIVIGIGTLLLSAFPSVLEKASGLLGIQVPANLLFIMTLVLLVGVCLHLSREQSQAEDEVRILCEEVALLRADLADVRHRLKAVSTSGEEPENGQ